MSTEEAGKTCVLLSDSWGENRAVIAVSGDEGVLRAYAREKNLPRWEIVANVPVVREGK